MKGQVEYKLPKKMKKRRQLDALVDSVKLPRSRKTSASAQELLDCHSESSDIDEFTLPQTGIKRRSRCCICQSIAARIGLFMVTMACLTTCVGLIWVQWHIRHELNSLRKQISSVQSSETIPPEVLKIQSQLAEVNKSVTNIKTAPGGLQEVTKTVADIKQELQELRDVSTKLQESVSASQEVLGLPVKINALSSTLATLGSDFKDFLGAQMSKYASLENRIANLETDIKDVSKEPASDSQLSHMLSQELMNYNTSLHSGLQNINQMLEQHSARISTLEEFTSHSQSFKHELNATEISDIVMKLLQKEVDKGEFQEFKSEIWKTFKQLNDTIHVLNDEFSNLVGRLDSHNGTFASLTSAVSSIHDAEVTQSITSFQSTLTTPEVTTLAGVRSSLASEKPAADLVKAFNEFPHNKDRQLDLETMNELIRKLVNAEDLKQFDLDRNGLYSEDELVKALGFPKNPR